MNYNAKQQADILGEIFTAKYEGVKLNHWRDEYVSIDADKCGQYILIPWLEDGQEFLPVERGSFAEHEINRLLDELGDIDKLEGYSFFQLNNRNEVVGFYKESEK